MDQRRNQGPRNRATMLNEVRANSHRAFSKSRTLDKLAAGYV
jgi:hypothetical protein